MGTDVADVEYVNDSVTVDISGYWTCRSHEGMVVLVVGVDNVWSVADSVASSLVLVLTTVQISAVVVVPVVAAGGIAVVPDVRGIY